MTDNNKHIQCIPLAWLVLATTAWAAPGPMDPQGKVHIPIGIANDLDTLKTFVEPEGCFSPGVGSYGIYFSVYDHETGRLTAPTMPDVTCRYSY